MRMGVAYDGEELEEVYYQLPILARRRHPVLDYCHGGGEVENRVKSANRMMLGGVGTGVELRLCSNEVTT